MTVLETKALSKSYGKIKALQQLNLNVQQGEIVGILGPNGSGKTTTLGILLSILKQDSGTFEWFEGKYGGHYRKKIGAVLETPNFYPYLNADQNLKIVAKVKEIDNPKVDEILDLVGLLKRRKSPFQSYSLGMKQRLAIGATLLGEPEVLIFDEPTNGLDPQGIADVRNVIKSVAERNKTIIMASHILDEVEKICSHVAILKSGELLASGPIGAILSNDQFAEINAEDREKLLQWIEDKDFIQLIKKEKNFIECSIDDEVNAAQLNTLLLNDGIPLTHLVVRTRKLEEEFITITSK
jgi:ABC-type multidrug transport system ATPase subunit